MVDTGAQAPDLSVIILTLNEEKNLPHALESITGAGYDIFVVDSYSSDATVAIAERAGATVVKHEFVDYAQQRNFALENLPIRTPWIFFLDADERFTPELKEEIRALAASNPCENGFYVKWRLIWMGKWVRRGYYPTWALRMFRAGRGRCEERGVNEHFIVDGETGFLRNDILHEDRKDLDEWIAKHTRYASREAADLIRKEARAQAEEIDVRFWGTQAERRRWLRYRVWNRMPPLVRPFLYFLYRYILLGGFLDGRPAFVFHFMQGLWFPLLIDIKYLELKRMNQRQSS